MIETEINKLLQINGKRLVFITNVTDDFVYYVTEHGGCYCTKEKEADYVIIEDTAEFLKKMNIAKSKDKEIYNAFKTLFDLRNSPEIRAAALDTIANQSVYEQ